MRQKYGGGENEDKLEKIPKGLEGYSNAKVFSRLKYERWRKKIPVYVWWETWRFQKMRN